MGMQERNVQFSGSSVFLRSVLVEPRLKQTLRCGLASASCGFLEFETACEERAANDRASLPFR